MNDDLLLEYMIADGVLRDYVDAGITVESGGIDLETAHNICDWASMSTDLCAADECPDAFPDLWVR